MNTKNAKKDTHPVPDLQHDFENYDYLKANSVTDCTGSVPRPPQDSAELDSYLDVYNFLPQGAYAHPSPPEIDMIEADKKRKENKPPTAL